MEFQLNIKLQLNINNGPTSSRASSTEPNRQRDAKDTVPFVYKKVLFFHHGDALVYRIVMVKCEKWEKCISLVKLDK